MHTTDTKFNRNLLITVIIGTLYALHAKKANCNFTEFQDIVIIAVRFLLVFIVTSVDRLN